MIPPEFGVSDMLVTVKSREIQRGLLAQMRKDRQAAARHLIAAAYLELVLAEDYEQARLKELALRSLVSAASCFWRGGKIKEGKELFARLKREYPRERASVQQAIDELAR
ncbi:MAG: hypothetical protein HY040_00960 [Planctomycetes bacterium]|nr:hypothetical protein [Planctomycetota bacterium]